MSGLPASFGDYELTERLGAGGMAETFVAARRGPAGVAQRVCLKRVLPALEGDRDFVRLFLDEVRLSATLRHANIAQVVDFGAVEGTPFLALELVSGLDLRALLRAERAEGRNLPPELVAYLALELATALDHAHDVDLEGRARGVVHRDISPSNVLLSRAGEVKLADFGIAKAVGGQRDPRTGVVKGKVPYMAPEYAREGRYDARSDLFAVGVVLFEALAGRRPYDGATELETLQKLARGEAPRLAPLAPGAPPALLALVERAICADPDRRFPTAAALLEALDAAPPPATARRALGQLVARHAPGAEARDREAACPTETVGLTRTAPVPATLAAARVASPRDETRTLAPAPTAGESAPGGSEDHGDVARNAPAPTPPPASFAPLVLAGLALFACAAGLALVLG